MKNIQQTIKQAFQAGAHLEKNGQYAEAATCYKTGNDLQLRIVEWDEPQDVKNVTDIKRAFPHGEKLPPIGGVKSNVTPIFILGMPRSGSTLIEQILSMHDDIHAAGELPLLNDIVARQLDSFEPGQDYSAVAGEYLAELEKLANGKPFVTDKMPANFFYIGLIRQAMPHAKIIHTMRDPRDTCLSCYTKLFNMGNLPFTYDWGTLWRYYQRYENLMAHWETAFDPAIHDVEYEYVVRDIRQECSGMLEYLGLPWQEKCLDFHTSNREVRTASKDQVTKPLYDSSIGRWEKFAPYLTMEDVLQ